MSSEGSRCIAFVQGEIANDEQRSRAEDERAVPGTLSIGTDERQMLLALRCEPS